MPTKHETSAGGIVFKRQDAEVYWLIIQHAGKGHWGFPKGHVGDKIENEKMEEAALREVREEGGIEAEIIHHKPLKNEYMFTAGENLIKKSVYYFLMKYISGNIADHDHEISDIRWATKEEVVTTISFPSEVELFKKSLETFHSL